MPEEINEMLLLDEITEDLRTQTIFSGESAGSVPDYSAPGSINIYFITLIQIFVEIVRDIEVMRGVDFRPRIMAT